MKINHTVSYNQVKLNTEPKIVSPVPMNVGSISNKADNISFTGIKESLILVKNSFVIGCSRVLEKVPFSPVPDAAETIKRKIVQNKEILGTKYNKLKKHVHTLSRVYIDRIKFYKNILKEAMKTNMDEFIQFAEENIQKEFKALKAAREMFLFKKA